MRSTAFCSSLKKIMMHKIRKLNQQVRRRWRRHDHEREHSLGDFTTSYRVIPLTVAAVAIGGVTAYIAWALLRLIALFTNLFYFGRFSTQAVSPAAHHLGYWAVLVPVAGSLIIGLMARFGSERIRGHGIPEAIESILIHGSRVQPRLALLKPLSSAISIGSGGPFGAEGPIIMTGGAFGSMMAQFFHLTSVERKILLVAGAAAGMSATFASPVAAVLLAVELLLFEWKPRSVIPVVAASATAVAVRWSILGPGPLFPVPPHPAFTGVHVLLGCLLSGILAGCLSALLTAAVYLAEDAFHRLPIHWMWWPALGGLVVGCGGLIFPPALGVGYDTIGDLLQGHVEIALLLGVLLVKPVIWATALGSGTSGGVLAPLLMMGAALGGLETHLLPAVFTPMGGGFWPLVSLGAILGGTMRSPLTGMLFAVELTHDTNVLLPLLVASFAAHAFTVLTLRRSILTEKVARRGFHLSREYSVDPLELLRVRDVMRHDAQETYPVLATHPEETLRMAVHRMAEGQVTQLAVTNGDNGALPIGLVTLEDLLHARTRHLHEERSRERVLRVKMPRGAPVG
jgi:H+/Cl- antiporter ClcA